MRLEEWKDSEGKTIVKPSVAKTLKEYGIETVEILARTTKRQLEDMPGIGPKTTHDLWSKALTTVFGEEQYITAEEYMKKRETVEKLTTGSKNVDELIGGGLETQSITEVAGEEGSGKTQLMMQLCVNVQQSKDYGGLEGNALFFDTEGTFRPDRVKQMIEGLPIWKEPKPALTNIIYAQCFTTDHQVFLAQHLDKVIQENNIRLIIVDGIMTHFRSEYIGRETLSPRQQLLNHYLNLLHDKATAYNLAVVGTNQVTANPQAFTAPAKPIGGHILGHRSTTRLWIRKPHGKKPERIMALNKNPELPEGETVFLITERGIQDKEEEE